MTQVPALFREYEENGAPWTGTYWWGEISDLGIPGSFFEAAHRLIRSARDGEDREQVLLPILYLYRHAIEQLLKRIVHEAAALRRAHGESDESLSHAVVQATLERQIRHDIRKLLAKIDAHFEVLQAAPISARSRRLLELLIETDNRGNAFRFAGQLTEQHISIDLIRLSADLDSLYWELTGAVDYLDSLTSAQSEWNEYAGDYQD